MSPFILYLGDRNAKRTLVWPNRSSDPDFPGDNLDCVADPLQVCLRLHFLASESRIEAQVATIEESGATRLLSGEGRR